MANAQHSERGFDAPNWDDALAAYDKALNLDLEYDRTVWIPAYEAEQAGGPKIPEEVEKRVQSLMDMRRSAEVVLMPIPAETAEQVLIKLLISSGADRECDGWLNMIIDEAERLTGRTAQ